MDGISPSTDTTRSDTLSGAVSTRAIRPYLLALSIVSAAPIALAQTPPSPSAVAEARERFQRGLDLSDEGNFTAAMTEFRRAYEITRNPAVLFNISATHEASGHFVEALEAMEQYRRDAPADAVSSHRTELDAAVARLRNRIGTLIVRVEAPGLEVRIDGLPRPSEAFRTGAPISAGRHRVVLIAPNFQSGEHEVDVAGGTTVELNTPLVPSRSSIAFDVNIPGAEILIDNRAMAVSPVASPLGVAEGNHHVTVRRAGYSTYETDVNSIGAGARVTATLSWQSGIPREQGARMVLAANELGAVASIDGRRVASDGSEVLPPGPHRLRVERTDYLPEELDVDLAANRETTVHVRLQPTPVYRDRYMSHRGSVLTTGWILSSVGVAAIAAGVSVFFINESARNRHTADVATLQSRETACGRSCTNLQAIQTQRVAAEDLLFNDDVVRWSAVGVAGAGLATLVTGIVVLAGAPSGRVFDASTARRWRLAASPRELSLALDF